MTCKGRGGSAKFFQSDRVTRNSTKNLRNNTTDPYTLEDDHNTKKVKETGDKNNNIEQHDNVMDMDITLDTYGTNIHNTRAQTTLVTTTTNNTKLISETLPPSNIIPPQSIDDSIHAPNANKTVKNSNTKEKNNASQSSTPTIVEKHSLPLNLNTQDNLELVKNITRPTSYIAKALTIWFDKCGSLREIKQEAAHMFAHLASYTGAAISRDINNNCHNIL